MMKRHECRPLGGKPPQLGNYMEETNMNVGPLAVRSNGSADFQRRKAES